MAMLYPFAASTDFAGKGKVLKSWHVSQGTGAQTINFRSGGASGAIQFSVQLAATTSASQVYPPGAQPVFVNSLYVEIVGTGFSQGCVDLG